MSNESRNRVADAWQESRPCQGTNVFTDGDGVYSYAHQVGNTDSSGMKVAYDCHYSKTTAKHCSAFKVVADRVIECLTCKYGKRGKS